LRLLSKAQVSINTKLAKHIRLPNDISLINTRDKRFYTKLGLKILLVRDPV